MENEKKNGGIGFLKEIKKITMARCPFHFEVKKHMPCLFIFTVKVGKGTLSICNNCKNFLFKAAYFYRWENNECIYLHNRVLFFFWCNKIQTHSIMQMACKKMMNTFLCSRYLSNIVTLKDPIPGIIKVNIKRSWM